MKEKPKVAVLYYNAGLGHLREALAIKEIISPYYKKVDLIDIIRFMPGHSKKIGQIYEFMQRTGLFNIISLSFYKNPPDMILTLAHRKIRVSNKKLTKPLISFLKKNRYTLVITTHFFAAGALSFDPFYKKRTINIVVDNLYKNSAWVYAHPGIMHLVPTKTSFFNVYNKGAYGVRKEEIVLSGHPFSPGLIKDIVSTNKRRIMKFRTKKPLGILITTGGGGTNYKDILKILKDGIEMIEKKKIYITVWCNHYPGMAKKLRDLFSQKRFPNVRILHVNDKIDAVNGLHKEMKKADLLITKPGELALYGGITPMFLFGPTGSQEVSLGDFAYENKYALPVKSMNNVIEYADSHRKELIKLTRNGMKNPLIKMQKQKKMLNYILNFQKPF